MDQHTGGMWLIHSTKHHKDNHLQSLELPCSYEKAMIKQYNNVIWVSWCLKNIGISIGC